ncbi:hypothetical protein Tco_0910687 [Tanacetum coccineum]|uniref:Uncharacterized protein n=1 Tax=Tanacetum coccineum TaxID=301880 RepID=A0ABQ5CVA9_9ASTR
MSSSLFINSFSPGDGEDDCWVFDVDVTDSGCFCVLVDVSMGSETVSRFWVKLCNRLHSSFSSFSMEIACSLRELGVGWRFVLSRIGCLVRILSTFFRLKSILEGVFLLLGGGLEASNQLVFDASPS